jgi:hypothetical protein
MKKTDHMQDPEFEKQVQKKMEELNFSPSDSVWKTVEKEIKMDRKRNRGFFLLFLCLGFVLSGLVYVLISLEKYENRKSAGYPNQKPQSSTAFEREASAKQRIQSGKLVTSPVVRDIGKLDPETEKIRKNSPVSQPVHKIETASNIAKNKNSEKFGRASIPKKDRAVGIASNSYTFNNDKKMNKSAEPWTAVDGNRKTQTDTANILVEKISVLPVKTQGMDSSKSTEEMTESAKNTDKSKKKSAWHLGFTAAPGLSSIEQELFQTGRVADPAAFNSFAPGGGGGTRSSPSSFKQGISVSAGLFLKRSINKKISLSIGLNYHYYTTKIQTGSKVDSFLLIYPYNVTNNGSVALPAYYRSGSAENFTNHYHFIELPVFLQLQLNHSRKIPLYWEAGASLSQFISSDGLHFNSASGVYYKDNGLFNKTQFSVSSSFLVSFSCHHALFQVGPQLQYYFTDLLKNNQGNKEHLIFGGVKFIFIPHKK